MNGKLCLKSTLYKKNKTSTTYKSKGPRMGKGGANRGLFYRQLDFHDGSRGVREDLDLALKGVTKMRTLIVEVIDRV